MAVDMQLKYYIVILTVVLALSIKSMSLPQVTDEELYKIINKILKSSELAQGKNEEMDLLIDEIIPEQVNANTKLNVTNLKVTNNTDSPTKESNIYYVTTKVNPSIVFRPNKGDDLRKASPVNDTSNDDIRPKTRNNEPVQLNKQNITDIKPETPSYRSGMNFVKKPLNPMPKEAPTKIQDQISNDDNLTLRVDPSRQDSNSYPLVPTDNDNYIVVTPSEMILHYLLQKERVASHDPKPQNRDEINEDLLFGTSKMAQQPSIMPTIKSKLELTAGAQNLFDYTLLHNLQNAEHKEENEREIIKISENFRSFPNVPHRFPNVQLLTPPRIPLGNCRHCYNIEPLLKPRPPLDKMNFLINPLTNLMSPKNYGFKIF